MRAPHSPPQAKVLILIGPAGAGKTTLARRLGRAWGWPVVDLDRQVVRRSGRPVPALFNPAAAVQPFRLHERAALRALQRHPRPFLLATGGGTPLSFRNRSYLRRLGPCRFVEASPTALVRHLRPVQNTRPRYAGKPLRQAVLQDWRRRLRYYKALTIPVSPA